MATQTYQVLGYYQGAKQSQVTFTVQAMSERMVLDFCKGFIPQLVVCELETVSEPAKHHYHFAEVNPVISVRQHLGNRRRIGSAGVHHRPGRGRREHRQMQSA